MLTADSTVSAICFMLSLFESGTRAPINEIKAV